jgi:hypothetical protein
MLTITINVLKGTLPVTNTVLVTSIDQYTDTCSKNLSNLGGITLGVISTERKADANRIVAALVGLYSFIDSKFLTDILAISPDLQAIQNIITQVIIVTLSADIIWVYQDIVIYNCS